MAAVAAVSVQNQAGIARPLKLLLGQLRAPQRVLAAPVAEPHHAIRPNLLRRLKTPLDAAETGPLKAEQTMRWAMAV